MRPQEAMRGKLNWSQYSKQNEHKIPRIAASAKILKRAWKKRVVRLVKTSGKVKHLIKNVKVKIIEI
jgi:hypothetical protein